MESPQVMREDDPIRVRGGIGSITLDFCSDVCGESSLPLMVMMMHTPHIAQQLDPITQLPIFVNFFAVVGRCCGFDFFLWVCLKLGLSWIRSSSSSSCCCCYWK
jgi:hypothetical protein